MIDRPMGYELRRSASVLQREGRIPTQPSGIGLCAIFSSGERW
jgi:hypothetical protein